MLIRPSRRGIALVCSAFLIACGNGDTDEAATEDQLPPAATPAPPAASPLAAFAGTWSVRVLNEAGDSLTSYQFTATDSRDGWMITFPGREPLPLRVLDAAGDSVVTEVGPYESVLRPGVQVTTRNVSRVQGDQVTGTFRATYVGAGADSVLTGRVMGTRTN